MLPDALTLMHLQNIVVPRKLDNGSFAKCGEVLTKASLTSKVTKLGVEIPLTDLDTSKSSLGCTTLPDLQQCVKVILLIFSIICFAKAFQL